MISRFIVISIIILLLATLGVGCSGSPATDYSNLIDNLRKEGANVEPAGEVNQPFFSVVGQVIIVNGENVEVFEYNDELAANTDTGLISDDGSTIARQITHPKRLTMIGWIATPHFYRAGKIMQKT